MGEKQNGRVATKEASPTQAPTAAGLPLFFKAPRAVAPERHGPAGIRQIESFDFARGTNSIPLNAIEFLEAAKYYPIGFTQNDPIVPVAIVGLEEQNIFLHAQGKWEPHTYIPAYVRKYPFVFLEVPERKEFVLCVDESSPHFAKSAGRDDMKFFDGDKPSVLTQNALAFCGAFQEHFALTRRFCDKLKELDVLVPQQSNVELASGKTMRLTGFQLIDQEKFSKLPDDVVLDCYKQGFLALIYYAMQSLSNWPRLLELANPSPSA